MGGVGRSGGRGLGEGGRRGQAPQLFLKWPSVATTVAPNNPLNTKIGPTPHIE